MCFREAMLTAKRLEHPLVQKYYSGLRGLYKEGFVVIESSGCRLNNEFMDDAQRILDLDVKEDDVWIITFPKCGKVTIRASFPWTELHSKSL